MKRYFIVSDIHSFAGYFEKALKEAGFRKTNKDHILVVAGDIFDRGYDSVGVYRFITSIPKSRRILIKGNHEQLYLKLLNKSYPSRYDFSNGTVRTFCDIAEVPEISVYDRYFLSQDGQAVEDYWQSVREKVRNSEITKWLMSDEWKNYFELDNFIIVHSFIPLKFKHIDKIDLLYCAEPDSLEPVINWRENATQEMWDAATWGCPWKFYKAGLFDEEIKNGKTLICGHWHTSDFYKNLDNKIDYDIEEKCPIYNRDNIIALDACTVLSNRVNVLVIDI